LEEALLHGAVVNIETKRIELEAHNIIRREIRKHNIELSQRKMISHVRAVMNR
jgi:hypothetical protein